MKLNKIINTLSIAAVALFATGCADTDAQYSIPEVGAPEFVSITPAEDGALVFGDKTITVKFDKNVNFMTKNTSQITLNGVPVKKALVLGASNELTIYADVSFDKTQNLVIPAGLITGPQGDAYDKEINVTWTIKDRSSLPSAALAMTEKLGWGWNLGNHFDSSGDTSGGYWDGVASADVNPFGALVAAGAKTVRIPTTWTNHIKEGTGRSDENPLEWKDAGYLDEVASVVDRAINAGLNVILNTHHDTFETSLAQAAVSAEQAKGDSTLISQLWTAIATKFKDSGYGEKLIFETFNEVHGGDDWSTGSDAQFALLNKWHQYAVDAIRKTGGENATRWIAISGYAASIDKTVNYLEIPKKLNSETETDDKIIVAAHSYDPGGFAQNPYDAKNDSLKVYTWGHNARSGYSVSGANEDYIINLLYQLRAKFIEKGIPCYLGEYGCVYVDPTNAKKNVEAADAYKKFNTFRKYYLEFFCKCAYLAGIPMFYWDNNVIDNTPYKDGDDWVMPECFTLFNHATGEYTGDAEDIVPMMIKACTDDSYSDFPAIWNNSPAAK
ncbi:MAG: cellulase family glycosylhydrolase [Prevotella sp.]|nr:cellulase family glycosylhydrolase [Prevotella sp.]